MNCACLLACAPGIRACSDALPCPALPIRLASACADMWVLPCGCDLLTHPCNPWAAADSPV